MTDNKSQFLLKLSKTFNVRHDFNTFDVNLLQENFPNVKFQNIPTAWVCLIDSFLNDVFDLNQNLNITITQSFGLFIVSFSDKDIIDDNIHNLISKYESEIYDIDKDLHSDFEKKSSHLKEFYELEN